MALPPWLPPLARWSLVLGLVAGAVGGASYASWASEWNRPRPRVGRCFAAVKIGLSKPQTTSGIEPYTVADGRTVYLTTAADRAVRCASDLGPAKAQALADALGEEEPEARAAKLVALLEAIPADDRGDAEAVSMGHLVEGGLDALPRSEAIVAADRRATDIVECRFGGAGCQRRPPIPVVAWIGGGVGAIGLLVALVHVIRAAAARVAARKKKTS